VLASALRDRGVAEAALGAEVAIGPARVAFHRWIEPTGRSRSRRSMREGFAAIRDFVS